MEFHKNQLYHIYNQGNNKRTIFFSDENYEFFLWKMRSYLLPFGDLIAWCLMPNHFHWQFFVKEIAIHRKTLWKHTDDMEYQRRFQKFGSQAITVERASRRTADEYSLITLNSAIGTLQKSYTEALNKEKGKEDYRFRPDTDYGFQCFQYIHNNPVEAKKVKRAIDYPWSSARDYAGLRKGNLCNLEMGRQLRNFM